MFKLSSRGDSGGAGDSSPLLEGFEFPVRTAEGDVPRIPPEDWVIEVDGLVARPLTIDHAGWQALPRVSLTRDFHCVEGWSVDEVMWSGVRVSDLLAKAEPLPEAAFVTFHAYGGAYRDSLRLAQAQASDTILADTLEGVPLPPEHGGAVRLVVPSQLGYKSVKWVTRVELAVERDQGYWEERGYPAEAPIGSRRGPSGGQGRGRSVT